MTRGAVNKGTDFAWLLGRLSALLGPEVARGTLLAGLEKLGTSPERADEADFRALLRDPLRERLRLSLGSRGAAALVRDLERERFGPDPTETAEVPAAGPSAATPPAPAEPSERAAPVAPTPANEPPPGGVRRATDLPLALARVRLEVARRGVERLKAASPRSELTLLLAEHATALAEAEAKRLEGGEELAHLRAAHLRREAWQEVVVAQAQETWIALAHDEARGRANAGTGAAGEVEGLAFTLAQVRDFLAALLRLNLREVPLGPPPPLPDLSAPLWMARLEHHPHVMAARFAVERASLHVGALGPDEAAARAQAEAALTRARDEHGEAVRRASAELGARLDALRGLSARTDQLGDAARAAKDRLGEAEAARASGRASEAAVARTRYEALQMRALWHAEGHRLAEGEGEVRLLFGA